MSGFVQWLQQLDFSSVYETLLIVVASLVCITVHETSHGLVAYWLGDPTAKQAGRLSWNPIRHIDPVGLIMMAILKFGWAKPVPVDMRYFRHPKRGMALTALAGPMSNVILAYVVLLLRSILLFLTLQHTNQWLNFGILFLEYTAIISAGLAIFNLIPISPLDGSKILLAILPDDTYFKLMQYERYGMLALLVLMFAGVFDRPLIFLRSGLLDVLTNLSWFPFTVLYHIFFE